MVCHYEAFISGDISKQYPLFCRSQIDQETESRSFELHICVLIIWQKMTLYEGAKWKNVSSHSNFQPSNELHFFRASKLSLLHMCPRIGERGWGIPKWEWPSGNPATTKFSLLFRSDSRAELMPDWIHLGQNIRGTNCFHLGTFFSRLHFSSFLFHDAKQLSMFVKRVI